MPSLSLGHKSPFELLFNTLPDYAFLKVFGCQCFPWLRPYAAHKLAPRSVPCVFIGYHSTVKGYRCLDPSSGKIFLSRHVNFNETCFPYAADSSPSTSLSTIHSFFQLPSTSADPPLPSSSPIPSFPFSVSFPSVPVPSKSVPSTESPTGISGSSSLPTSVCLSSSAVPAVSITPPIVPPIPSSSIPIQSIAIHLPKLSSVPPLNTHPMITRSKAYLTTSSPLDLSTTEPASVAPALSSPLWTAAMNAEFQALHQQGTWTLVSLPPHKTAIGCKWVFRIKKNSDGTIARYKARLVAKGFLQQEGVDYQETFSPVAKQPTIRILLCLVLQQNWVLKQLDISNAFLHGHLEEEVYMVQPPGFINADSPTYVCKLHKALYGVKQTPRAWYSTFSTFLLTQGFHQSHSDSSLFIRQTSAHLTILLIYVWMIFWLLVVTLLPLSP